MTPLTPRQQRTLANVAKGMDWFTAALLAGYSKSYAKGAHGRFRNNPVCAEEMETIRLQVRERAVYDLKAAMDEADDAARFAIQCRNPMALMKSRELKSKLAGHLVERVQEVPFDLKGAMDLAAQRVVDVTPKEHFFALQHAESGEAASPESSDQAEGKDESEKSPGTDE